MDNYEEILKRMVSKYEELSQNSISEESDIMLRLKVLSAEVYNNLVAQEFLKRQMFATTATGEFLDKHALERGLERKPAVKATGTVTFWADQALINDIWIPQGVVVSTNGPDVKKFVTTEVALLNKNEVSVMVPVEACEGGEDYNVLASTVTVLVTPPVGITSVTNKKAFTGGLNAESDEELRERVLYSYRDISNGTNEVYYRRLAQSVSGVYSASVASLQRGNGTIDVYISGKGAKAGSTVVSAVQKLIDENREINVDVKVSEAIISNVSYTLEIEVEDGYSFSAVLAKVKQKLSEYVMSLGIAKPILLSHLGDVVYHTQGVKNYNFVDSFCYDVYPAINECCVVENIDIWQVK
ncbi:MAG: baseplate J/gp47 family protein [Ruminococcaceae bacterium]|nr:baseplate J/gp47 family protein [Oscillospiraceae bacterium]